MIEVNGAQFRTLQNEIYVNGERVTRAYMNGIQVYPEIKMDTVHFEAGFAVAAYVILHDAKIVSVDWGDGTCEIFTGEDSPVPSSYSHQYGDGDCSVHNVVIDAIPASPGSVLIDVNFLYRARTRYMGDTSFAGIGSIEKALSEGMLPRSAVSGRVVDRMVCKSLDAIRFFNADIYDAIYEYNSSELRYEFDRVEYQHAVYTINVSDSPDRDLADDPGKPGVEILPDCVYAHGLYSAE